MLKTWLKKYSDASTFDRCSKAAKHLEGQAPAHNLPPAQLGLHPGVVTF